MTSPTISIITITCRDNGRLEEMGRTLAASAARCNAVGVEWVIIADDAQHASRVQAQLGCDVLPYVIGPNARDGVGVDVHLYLSEPTPHRMASDRRPAHNAARNTGLEHARGAYVVFLDDCTVVTRNMIELVRDCAARGVGMRPRAWPMPDFKVPGDGVIAFKDHNDLLRPVPPASIAGGCWGAPRAAFEKIGGFDRAYDGEERHHDTDAAIRMARAGYSFVSSARANVLTLKRTKLKSEVSSNREALTGARNRRLYAQLLVDKDRITPVAPLAEGESSPTGLVQPVARAPRPLSDAAQAQLRLTRFLELGRTLIGLRAKGADPEDLKVIEHEMDLLAPDLRPNQLKIVKRDLASLFETPPATPVETPTFGEPPFTYGEQRKYDTIGVADVGTVNTIAAPTTSNGAGAPMPGTAADFDLSDDSDFDGGSL